jgi:hypothetical protein
MPTMLHTSAVLTACVAAIALASPAAADPSDQIPGDGVFQVGTDIAPGVYRTAGPGGPFIITINDVYTESSMCTWFTHSTSAATMEDVVNTNTSVGPMYVKIPATVKAFETRHCQPWMRLS